MKLHIKKASGKIVSYGKKKALPVFLSTALAVNSLLAGMPLINPQVADAATYYNNGFEVDTSGWEILSSGALERVSSNTNGILSADGNYHAIVDGNAFTRFGGYEPTFPTGGYTANLDVYLDPSWEAGSGFDYTVASSRSNGTHLRDFIFHVAKDTSTDKLLVGASNNTSVPPATKEDIETGDHFEVTEAGWYTLQHVFSNVAGVLSVDLNLLDSSSTTLFTETLSTAADTIPAIVGGHRYGWFTFVSVAGGVAIDNASLTQATYSPVVTATNFNTHSGADYEGVNVGFVLNNDFVNVSSVTVDLYDASGIIATNTHNQNLLNLINGGGKSLSTPFITNPGTYVEAYWNLATPIWRALGHPTKAVITVVDQHGTWTDETDGPLSEATVSYDHVLPPAVGTVVVKGDTSAGENLPGWMFNRDSGTSTPFEFNSDQASIGNGSIYVAPIGSNPSDKFIAELFDRTPVSEFNSISYDFMIAGPNGDTGDADDFYLNIYTNIDDSNGFYDCRFDFVPSIGSTSSFTTVEFSADDAPANVQKRGDRIDNCPATLDGMPEGSHIRAYAINIGQSNASDEGLAGYLDNVTVSLESEVTTYDFEPDTSAPTVTYLSPGNNEIVGNTNISLEISDETNISQYSFRITGPVSWNTYKTLPNQSNVTVLDYNLCENARAFDCVEDELPSGTYHVNTLAYDGRGNDSRTESGLDFILDNDGPSVTITDPANGSVVNEVMVDGEIFDQKLSYFNIQLSKLGDSNWNFTTQKQYASSGQTLYTLTDFDLLGAAWYGTCDGQACSSWTGGAELPDGEYSIRVNAYDEFGNRTIYSHNFELDTTAPAQPQMLGFYKNYDTSSAIIPCGGFTNNTKIQIDWDDNSESDIAYYWIGTKHNQKHKKVMSGSHYNANMTPGHNPYFYTVIAVDHAGNESVVSEQCDLVLDTEAPVASITSPATDGEEVNGVVSITGEAVDDNIKSHWFEITGPNGYVEHFYNLNTTDLTHSFNWNTTEVEDGEYRIRYIATDRAGNRSDDPSFSNPTLRIVQVKNTPVVTGDYFVAEDGQLNVGFYVQGFTDANKVEVTLYDAEDNALTVNSGDSSLILALLNSNPVDGISSPFYIPSQGATDGYWVFGNPDWLNIAEPSYAIVTVTSDKYGDISSDKINFVNPGERGFSYEVLIAALEEDEIVEEDDGEVQSSTNNGKSNSQKGLQIASNNNSKNLDNGNNQGQGHEQVNLLLTQATDGGDDQDEPVEEDDNSRNEVKNQNDEGEVAGESASNDEFKVVGAANDEGCSNLFGICWYWYLPLILILGGGAYYFSHVREVTPTPNRRIRP